MRVILISTNAGTKMGGEAIKAYQYFAYLLENGYDAHLLTHARCRDELVGCFPTDRLLFVEDDAMQRFLWKSRVLGRLVTPYFHRVAARMCRRFPTEETILHYLCPISPAVQRFPPSGYRYLIGPLSGNVFYPRAFRDRAGPLSRLREAVYRPVQRMTGVLSGDKKGADLLLVSGYDRTRTALRWAGCDDARMIDVADAGVSDTIRDRTRITHKGRNGNFVWMGRMVDYKGADLAIRALARTPPDIRLTLHGEGPMKPAMQALVTELGLAERVDFAGWLPHERFTAEMAGFRGFVFPTLAEANGIVMQEAMMIGLPVITLRWGGPTGLANDTEALFVDPEDETTVIAGLASAMTRLASDDALAESLSTAARTRAQRDFTWDSVAASWAQSYNAGKSVAGGR